MYLCLINRWARATDPRDKVFGHLGLLCDIIERAGLSPAAVHASYLPTITSSQIYEQTMRLLIEDTDSLAVLMALNDPPSPMEYSLPSWVPDLSRQQGLDLMWSIRPQFQAYGVYQRPVHSSETQKIRVNGQRLCVNGTLVGTISRLSCSLADLMSHNWHIWASHLLDLKSVYLFSGESRVEAFWRTLLMNSVARKYPAQSTTGEMFRAYILQCLARYFPGAETSNKKRQQWLDIVENINDLSAAESSNHMPSFLGLSNLTAQITDVTEEQLQYLSDEAILEALTRCVDKMSAFLSGMDSSMLNRRISFSNKGHFANIPLWAEVGDIIVILDSCPCPLVLRPDPEESSCYRIVGAAYVHRIMYGESVNAETKWEELCIK